jgi:hypothetical protein
MAGALPSIPGHLLGRSPGAKPNVAQVPAFPRLFLASAACKLFLAKYVLVHTRYISVEYEGQLKQLPGVVGRRTRISDHVIFPSSSLNHWYDAAVTSKGLFDWHSACTARSLRAAILGQEGCMGQQLDIRSSLQGRKPKKPTSSAPSVQELAKRYFDLQCLRQRVRIAETGRPIGREILRAQPSAAHA